MVNSFISIVDAMQARIKLMLLIVISVETVDHGIQPCFQGPVQRQSALGMSRDQVVGFQGIVLEVVQFYA